MHDTLSSLIERALMDLPRPLEFYLREQSRLPGPRANLELVNDVSDLLAARVSAKPAQVRALLDYLSADNREAVSSNTPAEFVLLCGMVAWGACAAVRPMWRAEACALLDQHANSGYWRVREGAVLGFQRLLAAAAPDTIIYLTAMASSGDYFRQRAAVAAISEPPLLTIPENISAALHIQQIVLEQVHVAPSSERKRDGFRVLRQALGYTLSVVTAAAPEEGFALMRECATWDDNDIAWVLRENLKRKRLAKFSEHTEALSRLLAR